MATAPQGSWEHKPGCRRGNCQPRGQSLPPTLLWTQTLHQRDRRTVTAHRGPHRVSDRSKPRCLVTHPASMHTLLTHCPSSPPEKDSTTATPPGTVPRRIKTSIQAGEEGCHQNRIAEQPWAGDATTAEAGRPVLPTPASITSWLWLWDEKLSPSRNLLASLWTVGTDQTGRGRGLVYNTLPSSCQQERLSVRSCQYYSLLFRSQGSRRHCELQAWPQRKSSVRGSQGGT